MKGLPAILGREAPVISVTQTGHSDPLGFDVSISDGSSETRHHVTMSRQDFEALSGGRCTPERCIEASFRFLLDREPKEAILTRFDVSVIARYFPEFEEKLPAYIASGIAAGDGT